MVIAKLTRPCSSPKGTSLVLYCSPLCISEVIEGLTPSDLLDLEIEFIKVIEKAD